jgi:hypothetical protein
MDERVQVQGLGEAPTVQPVDLPGFQYGINQPRAGTNKALQLADSLKQINPALQAYGQVQEFQFQEGAERGAMEAATADLEASVTELDKTGEKLVEQGLLPRSQLVGYQRAFRERIGQREAKSSYFKNLNDRINEVTQNLESDEDIIGTIIAEEREKSLQKLGGSPLALQGFSKYSDSIDNSFFANATKKRDRAVQDFNEGMVIEDLNQDFGEQLTKATDPESIAQLQLQLKSRLDEVSGLGQIPRSRVIELAWNGFVVPNVNNLLIGEYPQPDKAEQVLDSILDIDLTGTGGKLGNINREGAYIRSKAVELKAKIETVKNAIKEDEELKTADILEKVNPAISDVHGGITGVDILDQAALESVTRVLVDTGQYKGKEAEAAELAASLIKNQDVNKLLQYLKLYSLNDSKRDAYGKALPTIDKNSIDMVRRSSALLSQGDLEEVKNNVNEYVEAGGTDVSSFLASGAGVGNNPITDVNAKAYSTKLILDQKANTWFENSETYPDRRDAFESSFFEVLQELDKNKKSTAIRDEVVREAAPFKEEFNKRLKEAQKKLKDEPNREDLILEEFDKIKTSVIDSWRDLKTAEQNYNRGQVKKVKTKKLDLEELNITEEDVQETLEDKVGTWWTNIAQEYLFDFGPRLETTEEERVQSIVYDIDLDELGDATLQSRVKAWSKADLIQGLIDKDEGGDVSQLEDSVLLIRRKWGFRDPSEALKIKGEVDYRETPMFTGPTMLLKERDQIKAEWEEYSKLEPQKRDLDNYPIFKKWNEVFGVATEEDIKEIINKQHALLKNQQ